MATETFSCDLSARLHTSARTYERRLEDRWLLFAPDRHGLPILVDHRVLALLHAFDSGSTVGQVLADGPVALPIDQALTAVGWLEESGYLRSGPDPPTYAVPQDSWEQPPSQFSVWLHINNGCNLACDYCFVREKSLDLMRPEILDLAVDGIARAALSYGVSTVTVKLAGGEPTLAVASMERAYDRLTAALSGTSTLPQFVVLSNGTAVGPRLISFLQRPNVGIGISLDGPPEVHDLHRFLARSQQGSWRFIARNIDRLQEHGIHPHIMTTLTIESAPVLRELAGWIFERGLAARFNVVRPQYDESTLPERIRDDYAALVDTCTTAFEELLTWVDAGELSVDVANQLHVCELSFDNPLNGPACGIGRSHVVMDHLGNLTDCVMHVSGAPVRVGGDLLADVRKTVAYAPYERQPPSEGEDCSTCRWFPVCGGGCPMANANVNGHPYTRSPLCRFYQHVIPRYLETLGRQMRKEERRATGA